LPFRDRAFDAAYSFSVINLLEDPEAAASEVARVSASSLVTLLKAFRAPDMRGWRALGEAGKDFVFTR
ncbi:MAG: methyltransferase domain-containing protein, partial [Acidilobus sp.]